ncbi:hypothetical protein Cni_G02186 [Canna indica]|uniref:Uncharacterized protein n=1 Tax=Canna indica TaxID=4628 RepID=A0AAQ3PZR9_9LILI|nr:hypothetical protein Cni_G02186 [Canna indica]
MPDTLPSPSRRYQGSNGAAALKPSNGSMTTPKHSPPPLGSIALSPMARGGYGVEGRSWSGIGRRRMFEATTMTSPPRRPPWRIERGSTRGSKGGG